MTDFRALCAELLFVFDNNDEESNLGGIIDDMKANKNDLFARARAALAQPEAKGPSETAWALAQLLDGIQRHDLPNMTGPSDLDCDRIWAARWGRPIPQPIPVSERLPGEGDCNAEGRCWIHQPRPEAPEAPEWKLARAKYASANYAATHWLPHWALPLPQSE